MQVDDTNSRLEKLFERMREVEGTLASHLGACTESGKNVQKSLDTLTKSVKTVDISVKDLNDKVKSLDAEKAEAKGIAKGIRLGAVFLLGFFTLISILLNIYFVLDK